MLPPFLFDITNNLMLCVGGKTREALCDHTSQIQTAGRCEKNVNFVTKKCVERENSSVESFLSLAELCRFTTDIRYLRKRKRGGR